MTVISITFSSFCYLLSLLPLSFDPYINCIYLCLFLIESVDASQLLSQWIRDHGSRSIFANEDPVFGTTTLSPLPLSLLSPSSLFSYFFLPLFLTHNQENVCCKLRRCFVLLRCCVVKWFVVSPCPLCFLSFPLSSSPLFLF